MCGKKSENGEGHCVSEGWKLRQFHFGFMQIAECPKSVLVKHWEACAM
jgi:hypothetical protein